MFLGVKSIEKCDISNKTEISCLLYKNFEPLGSFKFLSSFHPSGVDQISLRNS